MKEKTKKKKKKEDRSALSGRKIHRKLKKSKHDKEVSASFILSCYLLDAIGFNGLETVSKILWLYNIILTQLIKAADLQMLKKLKMKIIIKLTVNTGQVMFSGEIYYYWPLNSSDKNDKVCFSLHNLLRY